MKRETKKKAKPLTVDDFEEMEPMNDSERLAYLARRLPRDAYDEGRNAHAIGVSSGAVPWPVFDPKYQQWVMGWMDAHAGKPSPPRRRP